MEFKQNKKDGSCEIIFSEKEKKIINCRIKNEKDKQKTCDNEWRL